MKGAKEFIEEDYRTFNATFKVSGVNENEVENMIRHYTTVVDYRVLPNTEKLYNDNESFKKLVKKKQQISKEISDFINKHNE